MTANQPQLRNTLRCFLYISYVWQLAVGQGGNGADIGGGCLSVNGGGSGQLLQVFPSAAFHNASETLPSNDCLRPRPHHHSPPTTLSFLCPRLLTLGSSYLGKICTFLCSSPLHVNSSHRTLSSTFTPHE